MSTTPFGPSYYSSGLGPCQDAYNPPDSPDGRPVPDRERKSSSDEPKTTFEQPGSWKGDDEPCIPLIHVVRCLGRSLHVSTVRSVPLNNNKERDDN